MKKLNSNHLKIIAIIAMTIDHIADLLYPGMPNIFISNVMHIIGRLTAPIMFFFICEGYHYTKDIKKYISRLFIFALISHFAYCFAFGINFIPFSTFSFFCTIIPNIIMLITIACAVTVAIAAPATPSLGKIPGPRIRTGSNIIFVASPTRLARNGVFESPCAV